MAASTTQQGKSQLHHLLRDFPSPAMNTWEIRRLFRSDCVDGNEELIAEDIPNGSQDSGLEKLREKLLGHLREVADKLNLKIPSTEQTAVGSQQTSIPWNLRTRRRRDPSWKEAGTQRTIRARYDEDSENQQQQLKKKTKKKLAVSLSPEEIEEDVFALTGSRPRRRPKKRPRNVQRHIDDIFPGLWLPEISPESYRVPE